MLITPFLTPLIVHVSIFREPLRQKPQLIIIAGDRHNLGSWEDNAKQFISFARFSRQSLKNTQFLIENLTSPNENFCRPQDLVTLEEKRAYILSNFLKNYEQPKPTEIPTMLHFWGCPADFFEVFCQRTGTSDFTAETLSKLPIINTDDRHREVYFGESLAGWTYGPYNHERFLKIQKQESLSLTLENLWAAEKKMTYYMTKTSGLLHIIFEEMHLRKEAKKTKLIENLGKCFGITSWDVSSKPIAQLAPTKQTAFYNFLKKSPLEEILHESLEANALWHIAHRTAPVLFFLAGSQHTGHTQKRFQQTSSGLNSFLHRLNYRHLQTFSLNIPGRTLPSTEILHQAMTNVELIITKAIQEFNQV